MELSDVISEEPRLPFLLFQNSNALISPQEIDMVVPKTETVKSGF